MGKGKLKANSYAKQPRKSAKRAYKAIRKGSPAPGPNWGHSSNFPTKSCKTSGC